jgi:hypothetical protein
MKYLSLFLTVLLFLISLPLTIVFVLVQVAWAASDSFMERLVASLD